MIYPTRRAVVATSLGAVAALLVAALAAHLWYLAVLWPLIVAMLVGFDAWRSGGPVAIAAEFPRSAFVGEQREARVEVKIGSAPPEAEVALSPSRLFGMADDGRLRFALDHGAGVAAVPLALVRRGVGRLGRVWLRWQGPLGLVWRQRTVDRPDPIAVLPDLRPTERHGIRLFERYSIEGMLRQLVRGDGSDFDALVEFRPGMDRRSIDWKGSARATRLLARQYQGEKNSQIVFALDCGRQMSEPVAGLPRIDRVVAAMLLTSWLALRLGDRVSVNAFDSRPRIASGLVSGAGAFAEVQRVAGAIDYGTDETNYTFALTELNARLTRRSMIVLFTEFSDRIAAGFLLRSVRLLIRKHLLLVVVLRDEELEAIAGRMPEEADDVTRAVTAASLLAERRQVIAELRQLGVHMVEAEHDQVGPRLAEAYLALKQRDLL